VWYHIAFDRNWVVCKNCKKEFLRCSTSTKYKCPNCKLDNYGKIKTQCLYGKVEIVLEDKDENNI
jgi:phage FluMu protein Com